MTRLVERWGRGGFALASSLLWALPAAYWAGSVDFVSGPGPRIALGVAGVMVVVWIALQVLASRVAVAERPRRLALGQMGWRERIWLLGSAVVFVVLVGEVNAALTVNWSLVAGAGRARALAIVLGSAAVVALTLALLLECWRRADREFRGRR